MIDRLRRIKDLGGRAMGGAGDVISGLGDRAGRIIRPEVPSEILQGSALFEPFPSEVGLGQEPGSELLNVLWRNEALLVLSVLGLEVYEDQITRFTRRVFHDQPGHRGLSELLFGADYGEIHRWMDTVPGSGVVGGGIMHRLQHGHDISALREIYEKHGLPGALVWVQHNSQDLFTPTGVPIPIGSGKLADWLVEHHEWTKGKAALAVSFNAAEMVVAVSTVVLIVRLSAILSDAWRKIRLRQRCRAAEEARSQNDLDAAIEYYKEAWALSEGSPFIALALGLCYAEQERPDAQSFLHFRTAAQGLATSNVTIQRDGLELSLRGIAYMLALTQASKVLDEEHLRTHWRSEIENLWRSAVISFENTALRQSEPLGLDIGPVDVEWRPRPLSAAANYYLAVRACQTVPFFPQGDTVRLAGKADQTLVGATDELGEEVDIGAIRGRWATELRPLQDPNLA